MEKETLSQITLSKADIQNFISDLYNIILNRKPDEKGLSHKAERLLSSKMSFGEMVKSFLNSSEGDARIFKKIWDRRSTIYKMEIDDSDIHDIRNLFLKTAQYWRNAGTNVNEVYFSVLASPSMKKDLVGNQLEEFYLSGKDFIEFCLDQLRKQGIVDTQNLSCLDFGCGVGRLSFWASQYFKQVFAVDFSENHLNILKENIKKVSLQDNNNITSVYLENIDNIESKLPQEIDFVYSYIALQHNTPPVIAYLLKKLLGTLKKGGYALIHIPIHHPFYNFSVDGYLASKRSGQKMEMHILPKENIREICQHLNIKIIDSFGYGGTKGIYSEVFLFHNQGSH